MDYRDLAYLGLNEKEAKVYLAALELGKAPVQKIAEKAEVNRATTYVIIDTLSTRGLMSNYTEGKKQFFCSEAPEKLSLLFREEAMAIQRKQEYLDKLLPELKSLNIAVKDKPVVRYFEGKAGMRAMGEELYFSKNDTEVKTMYSYDLLKKIFTDSEIISMRKRRQGKNIKVKAIINDDKNRLESDAERFVLPSKKYPITIDIAFFGDKVRIATQKGDMVGLIIENKEVTSSLKILFGLAWKYLETTKKRALSKS